MLDDAADAKIMVQQTIGVAGLHVFRARRPVVHQHVVRAAHVLAGQKNKAVGHGAETFRLNAIHHLHAVGVELQQHRRHGLHVPHLFQPVPDGDGHGRAAKGQQHRSRRRLHHDVGAHAFDALGRLLQHAAGQADHDDDQGHLDGNRKHADDGAQGPMNHISQDQLADHGRSSAGVPGANQLRPGGCARTNRSAGTSALSVTE